MKIILIFISVWIIGLTINNKIIDRKNEKIWVQQYNQIYSVKNPEKVVVVNNYYDCKTSSESAIEGCEIHAAKSRFDTIAINEYLTGLKQYIQKKKDE